jgi:hypothetical protein
VTGLRSEACSRKQTVVLWIRLVVAAALGVLLIAVVVASTHTTPRAAGGDCGGKSCMADPQHDGLVALGIALGIGLLIVFPWRRLVARIRRT